MIDEYEIVLNAKNADEAIELALQGILSNDHWIPRRTFLHLLEPFLLPDRPEDYEKIQKLLNSLEAAEELSK